MESARRASEGGLREPRSSLGVRPVRRSRALLAAVAALVGLVAAAASVVLPARLERSEIRWEPGDEGTGPVFGPVLVARHRPEELSVTLGCDLLAADVPVLFSTTRNSRWRDGLDVQRDERGVTVIRGPDELASWSSAEVRDACPVAFEARPGAWEVRAGSGAVLASGGGPVPVVDQFATDVGGASRGVDGVVARARTEVAGSKPSAAQLAAIATAIAATLAALAWARPPGPPRLEALRFGSRVRAALGASRPLDALVLAVMAVWTIVGPLAFDDGWVIATADNYTYSGTFSNYYEIFGAAQPTGFLHNMTARAGLQLGDSLLWMRIASLVLGILMWWASRVSLAELVPNAGVRARRALAVGFLTAWVSWGMTLRPEPKAAVGGALALVGVLVFRRTRREGWLVAGVFGAAYGVSMHPAGVAEAAPLVVAVPELWRWLRAEGRQAWMRMAAVATSALTAMVLVVFADSDLAFTRINEAVFSEEANHRFTWRDELLRYVFSFDAEKGGTILRRASVLAIFLTIGLFATRLRRARQPQDFAVWTLVVAVVLLVVTPSKWPVHFAGIVPFIAVAFAVELERRRGEAEAASGRTLAAAPARAVALVAAVVAVGAVAGHGHSFWGEGDLMYYELLPDGHHVRSLDLSNPLLWALVALGGVVLGSRRAATPGRWWAKLVDRLVRGQTAAARAVFGLLCLLTVLLFSADTLRAPSWTLGGQNLEELWGDSCGRSDGVAAYDISAARPLAEASRSGGPETAADRALEPYLLGADDLAGTAGAVPSLRVAQRRDLGPTWGSYVDGVQDLGVVRSPWFELPAIVDASAAPAGAPAARLGAYIAG
ncbi:MAG: arabinosyltransferase domain-containing protein, partial [Acidimicrobiia bacterium]|nr:arabinosyltransferase domain-containing protein [Acidimicrobiia bacterium]